MKRGLLDTSIVISLAWDKGIATDQLPEESAISAMTLGELHHGVLIADEGQRPGRLATVTYVERRFEVFPIDDRVAAHYGRLLATTRRRRTRRLQTADALIAATAAAHRLPLFTRDRDFEGLDGIEVVLV